MFFSFFLEIWDTKFIIAGCVGGMCVMLYLSCIGHIYISASANICNVMLMRNSELTEGIAVMDSQNNVVGTSKVSAKKVSVFVLYGWDI